MVKKTYFLCFRKYKTSTSFFQPVTKKSYPPFFTIFVFLSFSFSAPLSVHVQPQTQVADVGKDAVLNCVPGGFPVGRVSWLHDGRPLDASDRVKVTQERLMVLRVQKEDQGMYQCFVSNDWDMAQAAAELQLGG